MTRRERIVELVATSIGLAIAAPILAAMWTWRGLTLLWDRVEQIRSGA